MDILFVTVTGYRTMTIEGYGAAFVGSALLLTSVCLTNYHNLYTIPHGLGGSIEVPLILACCGSNASNITTL